MKDLGVCDRLMNALVWLDDACSPVKGRWDFRIVNDVMTRGVNICYYKTNGHLFT
jgi:hypothetical protein